jgi:hypothetical protein
MNTQSLIDDQGDNRAIIRDRLQGFRHHPFPALTPGLQGVVNGSSITI